VVSNIASPVTAGTYMSSLTGKVNTVCPRVRCPQLKNVFLSQFESKTSNKQISGSQSLRRYEHLNYWGCCRHNCI